MYTSLRCTITRSHHTIGPAYYIITVCQKPISRQSYTCIGLWSFQRASWMAKRKRFTQPRLKNSLSEWRSRRSKAALALAGKMMYKIELSFRCIPVPFYSLVCVGVGTAGGCPRRWFSGDVCPGRGQMSSARYVGLYTSLSILIVRMNRHVQHQREVEPAVAY